MINSFVVGEDQSKAVSFNQLIVTNVSSVEASITFEVTGDVYELASGESFSLSSASSETVDNLKVNFKIARPSNEIKIIQVSGVSGGGPVVDTNIYNTDGTLTDALRTLTGAGSDLTFNSIGSFRQKIITLLEIITQNPANTDFFSSILTNTSSVTIRGVNDDDVTEGRLVTAEDFSELLWTGFAKIVGLANSNTRSFLVYQDTGLGRTSFVELTGRKVQLRTTVGSSFCDITMDSVNNSIDIDWSDGSTSQKIQINLDGILVNGNKLKIDIPSASTAGQVLTLFDASTKEVRFQPIRPLSVAESFNLNTTTGSRNSIGSNNFYAVKRTIPAGVYNNFKFYIQDLTGFNVGESCNIRAAIYDVITGALIAQVVQSFSVALSSPVEYVIAVGSDVKFDTSREVFFVFGSNDYVGNFDIRSPVARWIGQDTATNRIFRFIQSSGALPLNLTGVARLISDEFYYVNIFGI